MNSLVGTPRRVRIPYRYPEHLREQVQSVPARPGVYVFHGDAAGLPLYIGKSVNLRSRLLAHLRNRAEARLLSQARRLSIHRTAGEIGALLLEARMVKQDFPLLNRRLRRNSRLCSIRLEKGRPELVDCQTIDFSRHTDCFGLFRSRTAALAHLVQLADAQRLCLVRLGLEKLPKGRPCMRSVLGRCDGACTEQESAAVHDERLRGALSAMAVRCWPWAGAVAITETDGELTEHHVIRNWCHLGTAPTLQEASRFAAVRPEFDADCYQILCRPLLAVDVRVTEFATSPGRRA
jgi:excinuclease Cho